MRKRNGIYLIFASKSCFWIIVSSSIFATIESICLSRSARHCWRMEFASSICRSLNVVSCSRFQMAKSDSNCFVIDSISHCNANVCVNLCPNQNHVWIHNEQKIWIFFYLIPFLNHSDLFGELSIQLFGHFLFVFQQFFALNFQFFLLLMDFLDEPIFFRCEFSDDTILWVFECLLFQFHLLFESEWKRKKTSNTNSNIRQVPRLIDSSFISNSIPITNRIPFLFDGRLSIFGVCFTDAHFEWVMLLSRFFHGI